MAVLSTADTFIGTDVALPSSETRSSLTQPDHVQKSHAAARAYGNRAPSLEALLAQASAVQSSVAFEEFASSTYGERSDDDLYVIDPLSSGEPDLLTACLGCLGSFVGGLPFADHSWLVSSAPFGGAILGGSGGGGGVGGSGGGGGNVERIELPMVVLPPSAASEASEHSSNPSESSTHPHGDPPSEHTTPGDSHHDDNGKGKVTITPASNDDPPAVTTVPEPATTLLIGLGFGAVTIARRFHGAARG